MGISSGLWDASDSVELGDTAITGFGTTSFFLRGTVFITLSTFAYSIHCLILKRYSLVLVKQK